MCEPFIYWVLRMNKGLSILSLSCLAKIEVFVYIVYSYSFIDNYSALDCNYVSDLRYVTMSAVKWISADLCLLTSHKLLKCL